MQAHKFLSSCGAAVHPSILPSIHPFYPSIRPSHPSVHFIRDFWILNHLWAMNLHCFPIYSTLILFCTWFFDFLLEINYLMAILSKKWYSGKNWYFKKMLKWYSFSFCFKKKRFGFFFLFQKKKKKRFGTFPILAPQHSNDDKWHRAPRTSMYIVRSCGRLRKTEKREGRNRTREQQVVLVTNLGENILERN